MNDVKPDTLGHGTRVTMILINYLPASHVAAIVAAVCATPGGWSARIAAGIATLYFAPPVFFRLTTLAGRPEGRIAAGGRAFLLWWTGYQAQVLFQRVPVLEETLRMIPGVYSAWLRLWGARIGSGVYWTAGLAITDRAYLKIGDGVMFGAGVRLNAHVISRDDDGLVLTLAPVVVGAGALVGGYALLTAGTEIAPGSVTRAYLVSPPFSHWTDDVRRKESHAG